jgi:vacuolar protein sorting-associated protein 72
MAQRERRATAGKRMASLTGKAQEADDAFWGHDTWEEDASGNESFHSSDEDSEVKKDVFDSDFDDSESDREEEEAAAGETQERELVRQEKNSQVITKQVYVEGRKGKRGRGVGLPKRVVGDGMNAGVVLNVPGIAPRLVAAPRPKLPGEKKKIVVSARAVLRSSKYSSRLRSDSNAATEGAAVSSTTAAVHQQTSASSTSQKKRKRQHFTQEELLLEGTRDTEPENARWLLARKRIRDQDEQRDRESRESSAGGKLTERYTSRRGYLNTINFPEMDYVPEILTRNKQAAPPPTIPTYCVITGQRARYRDPRTGLGYYDAQAFRELRRRHAAGEPLDHRKPHPAVAATPALSNVKKESSVAPSATGTQSNGHSTVASQPTPVLSVSVAPKKEAKAAPVIPKEKQNPEPDRKASAVPAKAAPSKSVKKDPPPKEANKEPVIPKEKQNPEPDRNASAVPAKAAPSKYVKKNPPPKEANKAPAVRKEESNPETERKASAVPTKAAPSKIVKKEPPPPKNEDKPPMDSKTGNRSVELSTTNDSQTEKTSSTLNGGCATPTTPPPDLGRQDSNKSLGNASTASSQQSRRHSPRRRKPSARVLEARETESPRGPRLKPEAASTSEPSLKTSAKLKPSD